MYIYLNWTQIWKQWYVLEFCWLAYEA